MPSKASIKKKDLVHAISLYQICYKDLNNQMRQKLLINYTKIIALEAISKVTIFLRL